MKIYLDVCCLNRPFDDLGQSRIRLESEAVLSILEKCRAGQLVLIGSEMVEVELAHNPDAGKRRKAELLASVAQIRVLLSTEVLARGEDLERHGFASVDALHIACAEKAGARFLLTTDDRLIRKAQRQKNQVSVLVENPLRWIIEEMEQ